MTLPRSAASLAALLVSVILVGCGVQEPAPSRTTGNTSQFESSAERSPAEESLADSSPAPAAEVPHLAKSGRPLDEASLRPTPGRRANGRAPRVQEGLIAGGADPTSRPALPTDQGQGPGMGGDQFDRIVENEFTPVSAAPLSTFSADVDTASYAKTRRYLLQNHRLPPPDAVRIEEFINYFDYDYPAPSGPHPFAVHAQSADCPWKPGHRLTRIGIQGRRMDDSRPSSNLVFLIDVSGSMDYADKLPLVQQSLRMLVSRLNENDRVAIVVYAGAAGLVLPSTHGDQRAVIEAALDQLHAGGSTNGGQGIHLAYQVALEHFISGGVNRVLLCTDGDFNVGTTSTGDLVRLAEQQAKAGVFLSVLAFGQGNHNDAMLEQLSNKANGNYAFIDTQAEARKVLVEQLSGTLVTIAKDVKLQVEFNPARVAAYRLIGYENRQLAARDFNDDKKDAGEIGAGHQVTALYEWIPVGETAAGELVDVDPLKYQRSQATEKAATSGETMTVKVRYKQPDADRSELLEIPVPATGTRFGETGADFQFVSSVASFAMLLRRSELRGDATYQSVWEIASSSLGEDRHGYRHEFLELVRQAGRFDDRFPATLPEATSHWTPPATTSPPVIGTTSWSRTPASSSVTGRLWDPLLRRVGSLFGEASKVFWTGAVFGLAVAAGVLWGCRWIQLRDSGSAPLPTEKQLPRTPVRESPHGTSRVSR